MDSNLLKHINIVLVRPQHAGNIGAVARSIANHGLGRLVLVDPPHFDPERARWMAPNAHHIINNALFTKNIPDALSDRELVIATTARGRSWDIPYLTLPEFRAHAHSTIPTALMFGPEDSGLSNQDLSYAHVFLNLPTEAHHSLNLSQAVNICGAHLLSAHNEDLPQAQPPTSQAGIAHKLQLSTIESTLNVLEQCHYLVNRNPDQIRGQMLRIAQRAQLTHQESANLKGMANKVFHTLRVLKEQ